MFTPKLENEEISLTILLDDVKIVPSLFFINNNNNNSETKSLNEVEKMIDSLESKICDFGKSCHKKLFDEIIDLTNDTHLRVEEIPSILLYDKWDICGNGIIVARKNIDMWIEYYIDEYIEEGYGEPDEIDPNDYNDLSIMFTFLDYKLNDMSDNFIYIEYL